MTGQARLVLEAEDARRESLSLPPRRLRKPPLVTPSRSAAKRYAERVNERLDAARELIKESLIGEVPRWSRLAGAKAPSLQKPLWLDEVDAAVDRVRGVLPEDGLLVEDAEVAAGEISRLTALASLRQVNAVFDGSVQFDPSGTEPAKGSFVSANGELLMAAAASLILDSSVATKRGLRGGIPADRIQDSLRDIVSRSSQRTTLIALDQTEKLTGELNRVYQTNIGVTHYIWRTQGDDRVRPSHAALSGRRISWDDPPSVGHPGQDVNCRCSAEPDYQSLIPRKRRGRR